MFTLYSNTPAPPVFTSTNALSGSPATSGNTRHGGGTYYWKLVAGNANNKGFTTTCARGASSRRDRSSKHQLHRRSCPGKHPDGGTQFQVTLTATTNGTTPTALIQGQDDRLVRARQQPSPTIAPTLPPSSCPSPTAQHHHPERHAVQGRRNELTATDTTPRLVPHGCVTSTRAALTNVVRNGTATTAP